jgi:hypothetical protein
MFDFQHNLSKKKNLSDPSKPKMVNKVSPMPRTTLGNRDAMMREGVGGVGVAARVPSFGSRDQNRDRNHEAASRGGGGAPLKGGIIASGTLGENVGCSAIFRKGHSGITVR